MMHQCPPTPLHTGTIQVIEFRFGREEKLRCAQHKVLPVLAGV